MKKVCVLALLALGVSDVAGAADFSFGRPVRLTLARNAAANVAIGDANGDGRQDLASTSVLPSGMDHELSLFIQRRGGSMTAPMHLPLPPAYNGHTYPVAFADLDRDGADEIVLGTAASGVLIVRPDGAGGLSVVEQGVRGCEFMATGDVDADGNIDIACHDSGETVTVHYGNGAGGFPDSRQMAKPAGTSYDWKRLRLADVTGDGRLDLLVTASSNNSFFVFPNNGYRGFLLARAYTHPRSAAKVWAPALEVLDLDSDGVNEVVTVSPENGSGATLNVYRRGANGFLALSERIPVYDSPTALLAGDVDGDGDADLLAGHFSFNAVTLLGGSTAGLASQARYDLPGFGNDIPVDYRIGLSLRQGHSNAIALGDLNHDGCNDLAGATHSGVLLLYGCRPFSSRVPVSDFDGDGVSDLLWHNDASSENRLWQWADIKAWQECTFVKGGMCPRSTGGFWVPQAVGDFDADGNSDVFWREPSTGANQIWDRSFYKRTITAVPSQDWQVVGAGDFDGDDHSDLLWRNSRTGANAIWKSGNSSTHQATASVTDQRWKMAGVGDFNGDGQSDILWRHAASGINTIWRSGRHDLPQSVTAVPNQQWAVAGVGDFNGDGKDDVVWRNANAGTNTIWLSANSATSMAVASVSHLATIAAVGDYNGDGRADLMWHNTSSGENVIWRSADSQQTQAVSVSDAQYQVVR